MDKKDWEVISPPLRDDMECDCSQCGWQGKAKDLAVTERRDNGRPQMLSCPNCGNQIIGVAR